MLRLTRTGRDERQVHADGPKVTGTHLLTQTDTGSTVEGEEDERVGHEVLLVPLV